MKISDEIVLSARNLTRRKGRTALTLIGVVIGTCMVVLMISLGIAQSQANDEMLQSWGDLTQIQVYGGGMAVGADGKTLKLDDAAIESMKKLDHVVAEKTFLVEGMTCEHCKNRVEEAVNDLHGVSGRVNLKKWELTVSYAQPVDDQLIRQKVERAGYRLVGEKP